jgi:hypothetical protein
MAKKKDVAVAPHGPEAKPEKIKISNAQLLRDLQAVGQGLSEFLQNPFPAMVRIQVKKAIAEIRAQIADLSDCQVEALKKHGATETKPGFFRLEQSDAGYPAFIEEMDELAKQMLELNFTQKISVPCVVQVGGRSVLIVVSEPAASVLDNVIDWKENP